MCLCLFAYLVRCAVLVGPNPCTHASDLAQVRRLLWVWAGRQVAPVSPIRCALLLLLAAVRFV